MQISPRLRSFVALAVGGLLVLTACTSDGEDAPQAAEPVCETFLYGTLDSDDIRMATYAIEQGIVEPEYIENVEIDYLGLSAVIQATGSDEYDVTSTSLNGIILAREFGDVDIRAIALQQGHNGGGLALYTAEDSGIEEPADLVGGTIGLTSFGSTATLQTMFVLRDRYGLDVSLENGGDVDFVELDPPTLLRAVQEGEVDAADLFHVAGWQARNDDSLRMLVDTDNEFADEYGFRALGAVVATKAVTIEESPECVADFQRMYAESTAWARENYEETAEEIAEVTGVDAEFIRFWWGGAYDFVGDLDPEWVAATEGFWELAYEHGALPVQPDPDEIIVHDPLG